MKNTRSVRIAIGTVCLIAIALVMGWFVGRYIPGTPHEPEPRIGDGLYSETGYAASKIMDLAPGSTLKARDITQGKAYNGRPEEIEQAIPSEIEEAWKEAGEWEYDAPDFDLSVSQVKLISTKSFADWYPEYAGTDYHAYDSSKLVAATVLVTNVSSEAIDLQRDFPLHNFSLWGENLDYIDDSLGAGANLDSAYFFANEVYRSEQDTVEPGESVEIILPFKVNKNALKDQNAFDDLDPSDFCLQLVDFDSGTAYRLWL